MVIDECMTFFFAGSQTMSMATTNMLVYMIREPSYFDKVRIEIDRVIVSPYLEANPGCKLDMKKALQYDNIFDLAYYTDCFQESLRIEPPVTYTSTIMLSETTKIGDYMIRRGEMI
jgi:cytochrome P450